MTILTIFLCGCMNQYKWEDVTSDAKDKVNVLAIVSLDSTMKSFVKVHRTIQPSENDRITIRFDTTYYDTGYYDLYFENVRKLNYEYRDSKVIISNEDGEFQFFPRLYKYDREYKGPKKGFRVMEEVLFEDSLNLFQPKPGQTQHLSITTPEGITVIGELITPEYPEIEIIGEPDTLFGGDNLELKFPIENQYKKVTVYNERNYWRVAGEILTKNQNAHTFYNLWFNFSPVDTTQKITIECKAYDENYYDYFIKNRDNEVISVMLGESDHGLNAGIEGGIGVFGSYAKSIKNLNYSTRSYDE